MLDLPPLWGLVVFESRNAETSSYSKQFKQWLTLWPAGALRETGWLLTLWIAKQPIKCAKSWGYIWIYLTTVGLWPPTYPRIGDIRQPIYYQGLQSPHDPRHSWWSCSFNFTYAMSYQNMRCERDRSTFWLLQRNWDANILQGNDVRCIDSKYLFGNSFSFCKQLELLRARKHREQVMCHWGKTACRSPWPWVSYSCLLSMRTSWFLTAYSTS